MIVLGVPYMAEILRFNSWFRKFVFHLFNFYDNSFSQIYFHNAVPGWIYHSF